MTNQELFESIQMGHKEKKVLSLSKKLVKKCSFNRGSDVENLCHLAYWLYVYGCEDEALKLCEITHEVEFPGREYGMSGIEYYSCGDWKFKFTRIEI